MSVSGECEPRNSSTRGVSQAVLQGIQDDAPTALLAIRLFGQHEFVPDMKDQVVAEMRSWLEVSVALPDMLLCGLPVLEA